MAQATRGPGTRTAHGIHIGEGLMGLTRDGHGQVVGIAALEPPSRRERLSRDNLMNQLIPVMATIAAPNHSLWGREEVSGVLLKTDSFVVHDKAHLVIDRPGPWTCLTIAIKSLYVASGTRQITFERKVRHGQNGRNGTDGEDGKDATGNDGYGRGKPGGKGHDGGRGQAGTTPWLPDLLLVIGEVTFQNPDDARHLKIRVIAQGGNGGMGGNGGAGGNGGDGGHGRHAIPGGFYVDCQAQPGPGGAAGVNGIGGPAGAGADGTDGGNVFVVGPEAVIELFHFAQFDLAGGKLGIGGQPGVNGDLGDTGTRGSREGGCQKVPPPLPVPKRVFHSHPRVGPHGKAGKKGSHTFITDENTMRFFNLPPGPRF